MPNSLIKKMKPVRVFLASAAMTAGIFAADLFIEPDMSIFYALPAAFLAWNARNRVMATVLSAASSSLWIYAEYLNSAGWNMLQGLWRTAVIFSFYEAISILIIRVRTLLDKEKDLARRDQLTGLWNRRFFMKVAEHQRVILERYGRPFSMAYLDLDNFKHVNDNYGHNAGDAVIKTVAGCITGRIRKTDLAARMGGDEFAVIFTETESDRAETAVRKISGDIAKIMGETGYPVTVSAGIAAYKTMPEDVDSMVRFADSLMYEVKNAGKNSIKCGIFEK
ncbi:MAG: GGDEF domain-containing protein [Spirochaetes bacterium]|jgi:diguanylate cyclase (GGDEF)-like protein|nr:GGDEF domain-containing protein [Spirochaetota bacterium]